MAHYFQLADAKTCGDFDCGACWSMRESRVCPRCGFALSLPLSRYLNRPARKPAERGDTHVTECATHRAEKEAQR